MPDRPPPDDSGPVSGPDSGLRRTLGPLLSVVRDRHPDVDIVVLPPQAPTGSPGSPDAAVTAPQRAVAVARRGGATVAGLTEALGGDGDRVVSVWWAQGPDRYRHVSRVVVVLPPPGDTAVDTAGDTEGDTAGDQGGAVAEATRAARSLLQQAGWELDAAVPTEPHVPTLPGTALEATRDGAVLRLRAYPTALEIELTTDEVVLDDPARAVVRALEEAAR